MSQRPTPRREESWLGSSLSSGSNSGRSLKSNKSSTSVLSSVSSLSSRSAFVEASTVFVSHTGQDDDACRFASFLARELNHEGIPTFFDTMSIETSDLWETKIESHVRNCLLFICVLSANYFKRYWTHRELDLALEKERKILVVHYSRNISFRQDLAVRSYLFNLIEERGHSRETAYVWSHRWCENIGRARQLQGLRNAFSRKDTELLFTDYVVIETKKLLGLDDNSIGRSQKSSNKVHFANIQEESIDEDTDLETGYALEQKPAPFSIDAIRTPDEDDFSQHGTLENSESHLLLDDPDLSEEEKRYMLAIKEISRQETLRGGHEHYIRDFEDVDFGIIHSSPVATGLPYAPWAIYHRAATDDYVRAEYNAILRRTVARILPRDEFVVNKDSGSSWEIHWEVPPTLWVEAVPHLVYDDSVNRSRVVTWKNWTFLASAIFSFAHFVTSCVGMATSLHLKGRGLWVVICEVLIGNALRGEATWIARGWNNGSALQILIALVSPIFWCLSFSGRPGPWTGRWWRLPMWSRQLLALVYFAANIHRVLNTDKPGEAEIALVIPGVAFMYYLFNTGWSQEFFGESGAFSPNSDFVRASGLAHAYSVASGCFLLLEAHQNSKWIFVSIAPLFLETAVLLFVGEKLHTILEKQSLSRRYIEAGRSFWILAGTTMVVNLTLDLDEKDKASDSTRRVIPLTWVVRGKRASVRLGASGTWQSANILLPGPWSNCVLDSRPVVRDVGDGVTLHVLMLSRAAVTAQSGNSVIALGPALTNYFRGTGDGVRPSTYEEKGGVGFISAVAAGIVGLPIV
mmetsp:Transcript_26092/g.71870  ORF Transcript_26092/g.71870 Transcript_26092/m.71870 type:complete len:803 (+) Transcript_26092:30-2438(+)